MTLWRMSCFLGCALAVVVARMHTREWSKSGGKGYGSSIKFNTLTMVLRDNINEIVISKTHSTLADLSINE